MRPESNGYKLPIAVHVVVEGQFLVHLDIAFREDAHPDVVPHSPFSDVAIGIATVICEAPDPTTLRRINELLCSVRTLALNVVDESYMPHPFATS